MNQRLRSHSAYNQRLRSHSAYAEAKQPAPLYLKTIALALSCLLALGALAGCGSSSTASSGTDENAAQKETAALSAETEGDSGEEPGASEGAEQSSNLGTDDDVSADDPRATTAGAGDSALTADNLPAFNGSPFAYVNDGEPQFSKEDRAAKAGTERYGALDDAGRCTAAFAVVGPETQPTEPRGSIGEVKPTGWQLAKYDFVDGKYLYNRCHLLGFQLTGENANPQNLITGTRYMNVQGMLPFEDAVDDYVDATGNHVLMRVTPVFVGSEPVARGVQMEAESLEDNGEGVSYNVFCFNVQPGVEIDYATGDNWVSGDTPANGATKKGSSSEGASKSSGSNSAGSNSTGSNSTGSHSSGAHSSNAAGSSASTDKTKHEYVLNKRSKKFHIPSCSAVSSMSKKNREDVKLARAEVIDRGYDPCGICLP